MREAHVAPRVECYQGDVPDKPRPLKGTAAYRPLGAFPQCGGEPLLSQPLMWQFHASLNLFLMKKSARGCPARQRRALNVLAEPTAWGYASRGVPVVRKNA